VAWSSLYHQSAGESEENLMLRRFIAEEYTRRPFYGGGRVTVWLREQGYEVNCKRVSRLMAMMGIAAIHPKPKWSQPGAGKLGTSNLAG